MKKVIITESQLKWLLKGDINENNHYPVFLESLSNEVTIFVTKIIKKMLQSKDGYGEYQIAFQNNKYADNGLIKISLFPSDDIYNIKIHGGAYDGSEFENGKLTKPIFLFSFPFKDNKYLNWPYIKSAISHEVEHMYDDWRDFKNGGNGVVSKKNNVYTNIFLQDYANSENPLFEAISKIGYLSIETEQKAFTTQVFNELERVRCNLYNFRIVMKDTMPYKSFMKIKENFIPVIQNASENELNLLNMLLFNNYTSCNIPKFNYNSKNYNVEDYRKKLLKWADRVFHDFIKKFGGVVYYYVNQLKKKDLKTFRPYVI